MSWVLVWAASWPQDKLAARLADYQSGAGTPDQVISYLKDWQAAGMTYAIVYFPDAAYDSSSLEIGSPVR